MNSEACTIEKPWSDKEPDRGYTIKASYLEQPNDGDALVEIFKNGQPLRCFTFPVVEMKAQEHEMSTIETPKAVTDLAKCKASILRKNGCISEAIMYLSIGATQRAQEALNKGLLDL